MPAHVAILVPASLFGLAFLLMAVAHLWRSRQKKVAEAAAAEAPAAKILIHSINDDRCTGCDACVAVCPTDVLELVDNKSRVVRFGDCIQCEQCEFACPTRALVMHWEDEEPPPLTVPDLDPYYQTPVPGMYLVGEVAGKPLVKNGANAGRAVVEHMRREGLASGAAGEGVDVVIVGSGPGGLSAALTCMHHGYSYVILEKEQVVASTVARYPKGKQVMAEPYDCRNLSFLPVHDATKEEMVALWVELRKQLGLKVQLGEAVESVSREGRTFDVRTTVSRYRAQRVILATGTRGKPRTLGVPGENLSKVASLLEDPDLHRGQDVLVVGGGDSAVEAACALADAGARVLLSYRGKQFNRAQVQNRERILRYAQERRVGILLGSTILGFGEDTVEIRLPDGQKRKVPNRAAFVLIGADPPVAWLSTLGVTFSQKPHWYALGATDQLVESIIGRQLESPRDVAGLVALLGVKDKRVRPRDLAPVPEASIMRPLPKPPTERPKTLLGELSEGMFTGTTARPLSGRPATEVFSRPGTMAGERLGRNKSRSQEETRLLRSLRDDNARQAFDDSQPAIRLESASVFPVDETGLNIDLAKVEDPRNWFADLSLPPPPTLPPRTFLEVQTEQTPFVAELERQGAQAMAPRQVVQAATPFVLPQARNAAPIRPGAMPERAGLLRPRASSGLDEFNEDATHADVPSASLAGFDREDATRIDLPAFDEVVTPYPPRRVHPATYPPPMTAAPAAAPPEPEGPARIARPSEPPALPSPAPRTVRQSAPPSPPLPRSVRQSVPPPPPPRSNRTSAPPPPLPRAGRETGPPPPPKKK
jgi:thioredoxin reductase/NAD-dependent dihydropyrimidine dehydrogenase PreA subunit